MIKNTDTPILATRALTDDEGQYAWNRTPAMKCLMEFTSAIEAFQMDSSEENHDNLIAFFSDEGGIDWEEIDIPEDCFEFRIFYSLQEIALDLLHP